MVLMFTKKKKSDERRKTTTTKKTSAYFEKWASAIRGISVTGERTWGEVPFWEAFFRESPSGLSVIVVKIFEVGGAIHNYHHFNMSTEGIQGEVRDLKAKLQNYQAGSIEGLNSFKDAREGEMEGMQIKVAVFGMTGVGKSSLVNTIWKVLYGKESAPAIEQASGGEGTQILEEFHSRSASDSELGGFVFSDTRGFNFDFNNAEESKLLSFLCSRL